MQRVKRAHRWTSMMVAALLCNAYVLEVSAAISPPRGTCKPVSDDEAAAEGSKEKAPKPATGDKSTRPGGVKPVKGEKPA